MKVLIDGNSILFRYIFAIKEEMFDTDGNLVSGLFGFCRAILSIIKEFNSPIFVTFDKCVDNFRKSICSEYKANRTFKDKTVKNIFQQVDMAIEFCRISNIPVSWSRTHEADDIIATLVHNNIDEKFMIVTVDKDLFQLVSDNVYIWNPFSKKLMDESFVLSNYGIPPSKFALFLSLCGDASDNIKGVKGIGPKTAAKILQGIHTIEELETKYPEVNKSYSLVNLNRNAIFMPMQWTKINRDEMRRFFIQMNFNSIMWQL